MSNKNKKNRNKNKNNNKNKPKNEQQIGEKTLKLQDLQDFTVGQIVEESKRVDKENEENESVLDKYIRQHRGEIEEAKSKNLDEFIQAERTNIEVPVEEEKEAKSEKLQEVSKEEIDENDELAASKIDSEKVTDSSDSDLSAENKDLEVADEEREETKKSKNDLVLDPVVMVDAPVSTLPEQKEAPQVEEVKKTEPTDEEEAESPQDEKVVAAPVMMSANEVPMDEPSEPEISETDADTKTDSISDEKSEVEPKVTEEPAEEIKSDSNEDSTENNQALESGAEEKVTESPKETKSDIPDKVITAESVSPHLLAETTSFKADKVEENAAKITDEKSKNRKKPIIIGLCAIVLIAAGAIGFAQYNSHQKGQTVQTSQSSQSDLDKYQKQYDAFFTDKSHTILKNSQFSKLSALETLVDAHKNSMAWSNAVSDTESLKDQINAIKKVNALFTSAAITDGKLDSSAKVVANVKVPETPKTTNETLNKLLTQAIDLAKSQVAKESSAKASASAAEAKANQGATSQSSTSSTASQSNSTTTPSSAASAGSSTNASTNGLSSNGVNLEVSAARVQPQAGVNTNDPAFTWGAGIKEMVLNKARERGYITGDNYILVPTAIHTTNGSQGFPAGIVSGYYNLYAPDGRYLVSINAKTGFFVGNGSGHADNLDYDA
ncbi:cell division site-positioning protein MapZ family protein [Lactococcus lactis]|uniref:cell division site-positioning protein MapZ family protein n=1 Tax=Lactococcus lactis TaxID=1358 RepID=UPI0022E015BD|nr:cell division site-positioning protein MapZ family protein [Lactococcus lactis]